MSGPLLAALALQWIVIIGMAALIVGLFRQVGLLHERLPSAGALSLSGGARPGDPIASANYELLGGGTIAIGGESADGRGTLVFFVSPTCPVCKSILPVVLSVARHVSAQTRLVLASDGDAPLQERMVEREGLSAYPLVLSMELGRKFGVGKLPYAVLLDASGHLVSKGLINNREHLESLFEAQRLGVSTLEDFLRQQEAASSRQLEYGE
jgi:methylamine dehydrogenase accessory protein MauD